MSRILHNRTFKAVTFLLLASSVLLTLPPASANGPAALNAQSDTENNLNQSDPAEALSLSEDLSNGPISLRVELHGRVTDWATIMIQK